MIRTTSAQARHPTARIGNEMTRTEHHDSTPPVDTDRKPGVLYAKQRLEQPVNRLRIAASIWRRLHAHHFAAGKATEAISLALGHVQRGVDGELTIVLARDDGVMLFADDCYERRAYGAAVLRRDVRAQALWRAVKEGWTAIVDVHDHHFASSADFSVAYAA